VFALSANSKFNLWQVNKLPNKSSKKLIARIAIIVVAALVMCTFLSRTVYTLTLPSVTVTKAKPGSVSHEADTTGWLGYDNLPAVKAGTDWNVEQVMVKEGQTCTSGQAIMQVSMDGYDITKAQLDLAVLQAQNRLADLGATADTAKFDGYAYQQAISDAQDNLNQRRAELSAIQGADNPDAVRLQRAVDDAAADLDAKNAALAKAEADLEDAQAAASDSFDPFTYEQSLADADVAIQRAQAGLDAAQKDLQDANNKTFPAFDDYDYQKAVTQAQTDADRKRQALSDAEAAYQDAVMNNPGGGPDVDAAKQAVNAAQNAFDDAQFALNSAIDALKRAEAAYDTANADAKQAAIGAAQKGVDAAQQALDDANRGKANIQADMAQAQSGFDKTETDAQAAKLDALNSAVDAAKAAVSEADLTLQRARQDMEATLGTDASAAANAVTEAQKALQKAKDDLAHAQETYNENNTATADNGGAIAEAQSALDIAQMQLDAFSGEMPADGLVLCPADGTVYGLNVKAGDSVSKGSVMASIVPGGQKMTLTFRLPAETAKDYGNGATGEFSVLTNVTDKDGKTATENYQAKLLVTGIKSDPDTGDIEYTARVSIGGAPVPGAAVYVSLKRTRSPSKDDNTDKAVVLPSSCLVPVGVDAYVIYITQSGDGLFGKQTYVSKIPVTVADNNGMNCLVMADNIFWDLTSVVSYTTKPLNDRDVVVVEP